MTRRKISALAMVAAVALIAPLFLVRCCCSKVAPRVAATAAPPSAVGMMQLDPPAGIDSHGPTEVSMQNVSFRVTEQIVLHIHALRGEMSDRKNGPLNFDDKNSFVLSMTDADVGVNGATLSSLMNDVVFAYPGAPLRNLQISIVNGEMVQEGIMHKVIDIPFVMHASVKVTPDGRLRLHPDSIQICNLNGKALMQALGVTLEKMIGPALRKAKGIDVEKNDLIIEPLGILPPPQIDARLSEARIDGDELLQHFVSRDGKRLAALTPPHAEDENFMYFRGGTLRMGKLYMPQADMQVVDTDPSDLFDFFLDRYNFQLTAGYTRIQPDYGLEVFMRDFADLGSPKQPGERLAP
jgi:hypothetical protein